MEKHMTSIPHTASIQEERLVEPGEQLPKRNDSDNQSKIGDRSDLLTDFQRAALRWLSSFD